MVPMTRLTKRKRVLGVRVSQLLMHPHSVDWSVMLFCFGFVGFGLSLICKNGNWKVREREREGEIYYAILYVVRRNALLWIDDGQ